MNVTTKALAYLVSIGVIVVAVVVGGYLLFGVLSEQNGEESNGSRQDIGENESAASAARRSDRQPGVTSPPVSLGLRAGRSGVLEHDSGARIEFPEGATSERVTVSIAEVEPPDSPLQVSRAFDYSVGGADLVASVTIHIPFELEPGQDASWVHALHWDEEAVGWEPVAGVVDEAASTIVVTTDRLSVFSSLWVKVEASCATGQAVLGVGETLTVVSTVTSPMFLPVDVYMTPSVDRVGDAAGGGSLGRTEVAPVSSGKGAELTYETMPTAPGSYQVQCRIFWVTNRAGTELVSKELVSEDPPYAVVTVRGGGGATAGAYLRIEGIEEEFPTIYTGKSYSILVDVGNAGDERSGRFDLVADFTSEADGRTMRLHHLYFDADDPRYGRELEVDPGSTDKRRISVEVPDGLVPGEYRVCVGIAHADGSEVDPDVGACLDRYVLNRSEGAMVVTASPVDTLEGRRAWAALPGKVSIEVLGQAIEFADMQDDDTLRALYKRVAGELAFRKAVAPGPGRRHILLQGVEDKVDDPDEIVGYITDVCLNTGIDCGKALERFGLTAPGSGMLTKFPAVPNEAVSFVGQSVSGTLLFYDVYYTMLVNQALDLDQALDTLDGLEKLPLGDIWKEAVAEARDDVVVTASPHRWTAFAAAIDQNRSDILQFAGIQTVKGLVDAAVKKQLLYHAGIAGQKALVPALGLKLAGGPVAFVASVWFATEVYRSVEEQKEQLGTAALAAFINAAFSDPGFIEREFSDPAERANLGKAMAYAKYMTYDNLYKAEDGWLNSLSAQLKLYTADSQQFLEEMEAGREQAVEELMALLPESVEIGPRTLDSAPRLAVRFEVSPTRVSAISEEATVAITVSGTGGRVGDLPLEVRDRLPRRPLEVVMVVDRSGSMEYDDYSPTRLEAAKRAAETFLRQIQPGDSVSLVSFREYVTVDAPLTEDRTESLEALESLYPDGGTAIGEGIHEAVGILNEGAKESVKAIVLLSDGASNEGRDPVVAANEARDAGIPVFTVGIGVPGDEFDEFTLRSIAEMTGGEYLYAPDASELGRVYERIGGKVINVAGVNASLEIEVTGLLDVFEYTTDGLWVRRDRRLVYRYDQIPVGEAKTIHLRGRVTALLPGERASVIEAVRLTYQSLGSERERVVTAGPVEVEFDDSILEVGRLRIDRISFDRTEEDYPDSDVYLLDDAVRAEIELNRRPRQEIVSHVWARHSAGGGLVISRGSSDDDSVSHSLEDSGAVGRYTLTGTIEQDGGPVYDTHEEEFFVVFKTPREFLNFAKATTVFGERNFAQGKWSSQTSLNPRHPRILESAAQLLDLHEQGNPPNSPWEAARVMALNLQPTLVTYEEKFPRLNNDHLSDLDILDARLGDCTDMAALYVSMARALNIPARLVVLQWTTETRADAWISTKSGHAFVEVYIDGEWVHADPTWWKFDDPDAYLRGGRRDGLEGGVETSPGVIEYDRRTPLKYGVGLLHPHPNSNAPLVHSLDEGDEFSVKLTFQNSAAGESRFLLFTGEPKATNVRIRVVEDGGLDIGRVRLEGDQVLEAREQDTAELEIEVPDDIAESVSIGGFRLLPIELELKYGDGEGGTIAKTYSYTVGLCRGSGCPGQTQ